MLEAIFPAGDGACGTEQDGADEFPGMSIGQQENDVGTEAEFGLGMPSEIVEQSIAFIASQGNTGFHGLVSMVFRPCQAPFTIEPSLLC